MAANAIFISVPGKASDWLQKGAVIGYEEKEIQVRSCLSLTYALYRFENSTSHSYSSTHTKSLSGTITRLNGFPFKALSRSTLSMVHQ